MNAPKHAVDHMIEQLWQPALARSKDLRIVLDPAPDPGWHSVEAYWLLPRADTARLLVPVAPRAVARRSLMNFRGLRTRGTALARTALGTAAAVGLPLSRSRLEVQVRADAPSGTVGLLPLSQLRSRLGAPVFASTGVRTSDNRKAMLHLVDGSGEPVGYAKLGWNEPSDLLVATEADVLAELGGRPGPMRAPALLARFDHHGHPVTVTAPLPSDVRGLTDGPMPRPQELFGLTPVIRHAPIAATAQLSAVVERLRRVAPAPHVAGLAELALGVAATVTAYPARLPVTSWWHGDLAPWNAARDGSGQLWVWDWENAERDAVAGLDALHWTFSTQRLQACDLSRLSLGAALADAEPHLVALGLAAADRAMVAAHYAVTTVERACTLAHHAGSWAESLIAEDGLRHLLDEALVMSHSRGADAPHDRVRYGAMT